MNGHSGTEGSKPTRRDGAFRSVVLAEELEAVRNRRHRYGLDHRGDQELLVELINACPHLFETEGETAGEVRPEMLTGAGQQALWREEGERRRDRGEAFHEGLVGLALSGGGIRSATFNLGLLQALAENGLFKRIDYLSTVSGGGYIGSCLSSLYSRWRDLPKDDDGHPEFPFTHRSGEPEPAVFRHLRNHSRYLAVNGFLEWMRIPALFLRGLVVNALIILPVLVVLAGLSLVLMEPVPLPRPGRWLPDTDYAHQFSLTLIATALFVAGGLIHVVLCSVSSFRRLDSWTWRDNFTRGFLGFLLANILAIAFIEAQPVIIAALAAVSDLRHLWEEVTGIIASVSVGVTFLAGRFAGRLDRLSGKIGMAAIGFLLPVVFWLIYLNLCRWGFFPATLFAEGVPGASLGAWVIERITGRSAFGPGDDVSLQVGFAYMAAGTAVVAVTTIAFNVNITSMHDFYRDRLSKAYIFRYAHGESNPDGSADPGAAADAGGRPAPRPFGGDLPHNEKLLLSSLDTDYSPYHLVNATVNITKAAREEDNLRGRNASFFIFSKLFIGGRRTGYCRTEEMEMADSHVDLATAMAISGAAAAPNMGTSTYRPLVVLLAFLNVRLGYWLPNPGHIARAAGARTPLFRWLAARFAVGSFALFREMGQQLRANFMQVNVTDGGHIENLGAYELVRRQCRIILVGDAECDPEFRFKALANVIRLVRIDFGYQMWMDQQHLRGIRNGTRHHALGTIDYGRGRLGLIVYVKSSLSCDEGTYIKHYKATHPTFPHETTGDQFFDEEQFECYRALGHHVGTSVFGREGGTRSGGDCAWAPSGS